MILGIGHIRTVPSGCANTFSGKLLILTNRSLLPSVVQRPRDFEGAAFLPEGDLSWSHLSDSIKSGICPGVLVVKGWGDLGEDLDATVLLSLDEVM